MIAEILHTVLMLALLGALIHQHKAHARERQDLYDRIQAPEAASVAAATHFLPRPEPVERPEPPIVPTHDPDLRFLENA